MSGLSRLFGTLALGGGILLACNNPLWTDRAGATETLEAQGYEPLRVGGYSLFGCDTIYATKFTAKNPKGVVVEGVVCKGLINRTAASVRTF